MSGTSVTLRDPPPDPVVRIAPATPGTLAVGHARGQVGVWDLRDGSRLAARKLHGTPVLLHHAGGRLVAATHTGDHGVLDLSLFTAGIGEVRAEVAATVPVVWRDGRIAVDGALTGEGD